MTNSKELAARAQEKADKAAQEKIDKRDLNVRDRMRKHSGMLKSLLDADDDDFREIMETVRPDPNNDTFQPPALFQYAGFCFSADEVYRYGQGRRLELWLVGPDFKTKLAKISRFSDMANAPQLAKNWKRRRPLSLLRRVKEFGDKL